MWLGGVAVRALYLRLEMPGSILATALSSATLPSHTHALSPSTSVNLGGKQAHRTIHCLRVHGHAASAGVWLGAQTQMSSPPHGPTASRTSLSLQPIGCTPALSVTIAYWKMIVS